MSEDLFGGVAAAASRPGTGGSLSDAGRQQVDAVPAAGRPDATPDPGRDRRPAAPARRRLAAAPAGHGGADVGVPLGSARGRQDHDRRGGLPPDRLEVRGDLGGHRRGQGVRAVLDQARRELRPGPADRAVRRRGAPLLQDPAGRAAAGRGEPAGHPDRRHHGEPELLGHLPAAVPVAAADPAAVDRRRHLGPAGPGAGRRAGRTDQGGGAVRPGPRGAEPRSCDWPAATPGAR